jgi:thiamine biosynthesis lipoprotein
MTVANSPAIRHAFAAFGGAECEVIVCDGRDSDVSALVADVYAFEHRLTRFDPASELSRFNATAGARVPVSALLRELLSACLDAYELSAGLVNAACLPALIAAGYDRSITEIHRHPAGGVGHAAGRPVPPLPAILEIGNGWAALSPGCAVDLGGVGKGWLADTLCERFDNAAVNLGGDIRVRGAGLEARGWPVALCDGSVVESLDAGIATSGPSGRRWPGGHHLIDPRTGSPARSLFHDVSVVAASALRADVLAKGACLVGPALAGEWLRARSAARSAVAVGDAARRPT